MTNSLIKRMANGLAPSRDVFLGPLEEQFNQIMNEFFQGDGLLSYKSKVNFPKTDIYKRDGKFFVEVSVAAYRSEDLNVEMIPDKRSGGIVLKISGKSAAQEYKEVDFFVKEMRRSTFERSFLLPEYIQGDPEATIKDGILTLSWDLPEPKEAEESQTKRIEIKKAD